MDDTFTMSVGLAHELQTAFRRNGWTAVQVKKLTEGDTLARMRSLVPDQPKFVELSYDDDPPLGVIFSEDNVRALGPQVSARCRRSVIALSYMRPAILSLGDLCRKSERELRRQPMMGDKAIELIKAMLAHYGLHLASDK